METQAQPFVDYVAYLSSDTRDDTIAIEDKKEERLIRGSKVHVSKKSKRIEHDIDFTKPIINVFKNENDVVEALEIRCTCGSLIRVNLLYTQEEE